jgi:hypothetical protein
MSASANFSSKPDDKNDDFGDFEMPDLSVSVDIDCFTFKYVQFFSQICVDSFHTSLGWLIGHQASKYTRKW